MKKIILIMILALSFSQAGEIFKKYTYNQEKATINNLKKVDRPTIFKDSTKLTAYTKKEEKEAVFLFEKDKLKFVVVFFTEFDLKKKIEMTLKSGYRLQKIVYRLKSGFKKVSNVGELISKIKKEKEKANIFDTIIFSNLLFQKEKNMIIMNYYSTIIRKGSNCSTCDELKGTNLIETNILNMIFTEK